METKIEKDGANFSASGNYDASVQQEIISAYIRAQTIRQLALYGVATIFMLSACFLIVFSPPGREQASEIVAAALFAIAVGIGGFSFFAIKTPILSVEAASINPKVQTSSHQQQHRPNL